MKDVKKEVVDEEVTFIQQKIKGEGNNVDPCIVSDTETDKTLNMDDTTDNESGKVKTNPVIEPSFASKQNQWPKSWKMVKLTEDQSNTRKLPLTLE